MPPRINRTYSKKKSSESVKEESDDEKENQNFPLPEKNPDDETTTKTEEFDKLLQSPVNKNLHYKPLGFWSKKLKDLESEKSITEKKKHGLYDFSGTDDSQSPIKKKKKPKRKGGVKKKKQPDYLNYNKSVKKTRNVPDKKKKEAHVQFREQLILNKEREKLADKGENFTFSTGIPSLGVTSTPAANKDNLVGASSFPFMSPITKVNGESFCFDKIQCTPLKSNSNRSKNMRHSKFPTPKLETKLKSFSCRRVLRSGKVINT